MNDIEDRRIISQSKEESLCPNCGLFTKTTRITNYSDGSQHIEDYCPSCGWNYEDGEWE